MPQVINTNLASLNAQRNLNSSQRLGDTALQRLSSGLRINSAKDDAAGLSISTRFTSQIRGTQVAIRNSGDGISLAQTAEGALNSISTNLQRMRELALQSANDTNSLVDRKAIQEEIDQLKNEVKNIADTTNFNGKKLLDGSFQNASFQTGANAGDTVKISVPKLDITSLGSAQKSGISSTSTIDANGLIAAASVAESSALAAGDLVINGIAIGASVGTDDTYSSAATSSSAIAKAAAINRSSTLSGVTAVINENTLAGRQVATVAATTSASVTLNGISINLSVSAALSVEQNLKNVVETINTKSLASGVSAKISAEGSTFRVDLTAVDGRNIVIASTTGDTAAAFGLAANSSTGQAYIGSYTLISEKGSDITISTNTGNIDNAGLEEGRFSGINGGTVSDNANTSAMITGDLVINGIDVGQSAASDDTASTQAPIGSAIAKAAAINRISGQTGVSAKANANTIYSGNLAATTTPTNLTINGISISISYGTSAEVSEKQNAIINAINAKSGQSGVRAEALDADSFKLVADDGRNITLATASVYGFANTTLVSSITLESAGTFEIGSNTGNLDRSGFKIGKFGGGETGTKLQDLDVTTVKGATAAIKAIDNALQTIASKQAELGAVQNRFQTTISNLESLHENLTAANSRIMDADFAEETAQLSKAQVLQQAGISILSQANSRPQQVLSLLQ